MSNVPWSKTTALVTVSATTGAILGFQLVQGNPASASTLPTKLMSVAFDMAAHSPASGGSDAQLRTNIVNVAKSYLNMAQTKSPAQMELLIWGRDSVDGVDHGESCAAFAALTLHLGAIASGQESWVTGGSSYPWPLHSWADVRVNENPASPQITSVVQDAQDHGRWHPTGDGYQPKPGDWIVFDGHVEVVTEHSGGYVHTIGGDSGPNLSVNAHTFGVSDGLGFVNNGSLKPTHTPTGNGRAHGRPRAHAGNVIAPLGPDIPGLIAAPNSSAAPSDDAVVPPGLVELIPGLIAVPGSPAAASAAPSDDLVVPGMAGAIGSVPSTAPAASTAAVPPPGSGLGSLMPDGTTPRVVLHPAVKPVPAHPKAHAHVNRLQQAIVSQNSDLIRLQQAISLQENGGSAVGTSSTGAQGKYQIIDSTWASWKQLYPPAIKYASANEAPENVQDAVVRLVLAQKWHEFHGSVSTKVFDIAVSHFYPAALNDPALMDTYPPGNVVTPRQYGNEVLKKFDTHAGHAIPIHLNAPGLAPLTAHLGVPIPSKAPDPVHHVPVHRAPAAPRHSSVAPVSPGVPVSGSPLASNQPVDVPDIPGGTAATEPATSAPATPGADSVGSGQGSPATDSGASAAPPPPPALGTGTMPEGGTATVAPAPAVTPTASPASSAATTSADTSTPIHATLDAYVVHTTPSSAAIPDHVRSIYEDRVAPTLLGDPALYDEVVHGSNADILWVLDYAITGCVVGMSMFGFKLNRRDPRGRQYCMPDGGGQKPTPRESKRRALAHAWIIAKQAAWDVYQVELTDDTPLNVTQLGQVFAAFRRNTALLGRFEPIEDAFVSNGLNDDPESCQYPMLRLPVPGETQPNSMNFSIGCLTILALLREKFSAT